MKVNQVLEKRILVTDNDDVVLESLAGKIRQFGFKVMTANSGDDALNQYEKFYPDMVIIDEDLKKIDGLQLFFKLFFYNPSINLVLTTHDKQSVENNEFTEGDNFSVIQKPFSHEDLEKIFEHANFISKESQERFQ